MSDPFHPDDPWGQFDDVDTEDFGPWPACLDPYLPGIEDPDLDWEQVITKHMTDELSREIDEAIVRGLLDATDIPREAPAADMYPHRCPRCGGRAYVGMASVDCEAKCPS